jgi:hypothetical protein
VESFGASALESWFRYEYNTVRRFQIDVQHTSCVLSADIGKKKSGGMREKEARTS